MSKRIYVTGLETKARQQLTFKNAVVGMGGSSTSASQTAGQHVPMGTRGSNDGFMRKSHYLHLNVDSRVFFIVLA